MKKLLLALLYTLPVAIFFSYFPIIPIGSSDSTNFELSLPIIWLVVFFCATIIYLPRAIKYFKWSHLLLILALPAYSALSIFWSPNHLRAFLTAALLTLTLYAATMLIYLLKSPTSPLAKTKNLPRTLIKILFISTTAICLLCWFQCFLDILGVNRDVTLLCPGCTYGMFGFPHPNGLAIEPQFMGNLLLAPTLLALYLGLKKNHPHHRPILILSAFFCATLFLTFSRGAIYAFAVALVILIAYTIKRHLFHPQLLLIPVSAFCFTLCTQGLLAQLSPTTDTFTTGVTKSIHQLTLGKIDFRSIHNDDEQRDISPSEETPQQEPLSTFDGYVADSTSIRVNLTNSALDLWNDSPTNLLFGTGLGSAGTVLHDSGHTPSPKEIVQNQYFSLLLELGLIGVFLAAILLVFIATKFATSPAAPILIPLIAAYLITLYFFAGLPNALQIYLLPPLLYACLNSSRTLPNHKRDNSTPQ